MPVIIRVDGKAFHTYTRECARPFDSNLADVMIYTARKMCDEIQGACLAYTQSDEISFLLHNYRKLTSQPWFDNQVQKMCSVAAGMASAYFTAESYQIWDPEKIRPAVFDARVFVLPEAEVCNYFLWRQQDATRNSIQMLARSLYSHKECHEKNGSELQEMCFQKGQNWNDLHVRWKRGVCVKQQKVDLEIPVFSQDRNYIEELLKVEEE
jgi:tRNA(His) 5'-end guanylyltransferase